MGVKFVEPTLEHITVIADDMRQADVDEVWASGHHTPLEALLNGWKISDYSVIVLVNDTPCVMLGLVIHDILSRVGVPWLLGTENALKYKLHFIAQVPAVINEMLNICPVLFNYVHVENKTSVRWLKRIGFTVEEPGPYGISRELFHKFHLERVQ